MQSLVWAPLKRHKFKLLLLWLAIVGAGTAFALLSKDVFRSEGRLLVRLGRENVTLDPTANLGQGPISAVPAMRENEMYTVVETLRSRQLFESLVDDVSAETILADQASPFAQYAPWRKVRAPSRDAAVAKAERMLKIEPLRKSNLVSVTCDAHDSELAARMAAKYVELCLTHHRGLYRNPTAHEFFADQANLLAGKLQETEQELLKVKRDAGVTSIDEQRRLLLERASLLENELAAADRVHSGTKVEMAMLEKQLKSLPAYVKLQASDGHPQTATDSMRDQLFTLELREKELQAELTDEHFRLKQVREQLAEARRIFALQESRRVQTTEGRNPIYEQVEASLLKLTAESAAVEERRRKIEPQLAEVRSRLTALNEAEFRIAGLERDRTLQQADYAKYAASLEQVRIDQALEAERISNLSVAQPPANNPEPIGPDRPLLIGLSLIVATCLALGLAAVMGAATELPQPLAVREVADDPTSTRAHDPAYVSSNGTSNGSPNGSTNGSPNGHAADPAGVTLTGGANGHFAPAAT
jgi:uncharacterized protein involved in exopolysaccharide biosynthesis